ncbi:MAG: response regulator, partial [Bacteroidota bacterium]
ISGGFCALDQNYKVTYWNKAAEIGTGLSSSSVLGKNIFEVFPNAQDATLGEKYRLAMETKTFQSFETCYKDDRFEAWYDVRIYPADVGLSVFFQDITGEKADQLQKEMLVEMSKAINTSRHLDELCLSAAEKIAAYFDIPTKFVCIYLFDPRGNEIRLVAPAVLDIEFPQEVVHQAVVPDTPYLPGTVAYHKEVLLSDDPLGGTLGCLFAEEIQRIGMKTLITMPLVVQGELQGVLEVPTIKQKQYADRQLEVLSVAANDLAGGMSRKRLVDELRMKNLELETQTQKTLEASDTLKKFLAMFSHELRSPLNSIIGFSELLAAQGDELPPETVQDFMKNINMSGRHLQQIINDILDLSKIEAGRMELHIASHPISYFRENVERVLASDIAERQVRLEFDVSSELDELVVDQTRFKQILLNLVSNAVKFSNHSGTVTVKVDRVENDIQFSVRDEGVGVRPEELATLFKPFRQALSGKERNQGGMGLGLAITKKLVELHRGTIGIESEWGKGTTVTFRIPMVVDQSSERALQAEMLLEALQRENKTLANGEKPLALLVEDSEQAAELLRRYIESAGYRVEVARNGDDAVDMAKRLRPNVITLDLQLPLKDGWQVMKELKRHPLCKHIPVVIVSIVDEKNLGFSLGAVDYFVKPVNRDDLIEALDRVHLVAKSGARKPSVLVIDDDRAATDLIQVILENEGYHVLKAFHGRDGVELAAMERPDLIILDLIMPETSGFNVAYQLKQIPATRSIPIIILTSMEIDPAMQERLESYVAGLMSKSAFTKRDLLREISNIENARLH